MAKKKSFPKMILLIPAAILLAAGAKYLYFYVTPLGLIGANHYQNLLGEKASCAVVPSNQPTSCFNLPCLANVCLITNTTNFSTSESGSEQVANWKTYTNTKYSYTLKYPDSWVLESSQPQKVTLTTNKELKNSKEIKDLEKYASITIMDTGVKYTSSNSLFDVASKSKNNRGKPQFGQSIDGRESLRSVQFPIKDEVMHYDSRFVRNNIGTIQLIELETAGANEKIFDQILSSFKFTK